MDQDLFHILSGGARFDKKRFGHDVEIFGKHDKETAGATGQLEEKQLLDEIDFFKTTHTVVKAEKSTKRKAKDMMSDEPSSIKVELNEKSNRKALFKSEKEAERFRRKQGIHVEGTDVPNPFRNFEDLQHPPYTVNQVLFKNLLNCQYTSPTPIQMQAIPIILKGRDLMACAPTGSGKTLGFLLPLIHGLKKHEKIGYRALIIAPTRELALQIEREFKNMSKGTKLTANVLGQTTTDQKDISPQQRKKFDVLISTPLRLVYALKEDMTDLSHVQHLVLDEADKLLDGGFLEQTDEIFAACSGSSVRRSLFSATFSPTVEDLARSVMNNPIRIVIGTMNAATHDINQKLLFTKNEAGKLIALRQYVKSGFRPPLLVFVQTIERAKELFQELVYEEVKVQVIHSERTKKQRDDIINQFRSGNIWVLIATELMARGLDFKGVNSVINYDIPETVESYIHRIGRTGRAGRAGEAITYFTEHDTEYLKNIIHVMKESGCDVPEWMFNMKKPKRQIVKQMAKGHIMRKSIDTTSKFDKKMQAKRKQIIEASKKRKLEKQQPKSNKKTARPVET